MLINQSAVGSRRPNWTLTLTRILITSFKKKREKNNLGNKTSMVPDQTGTKDFSDKCWISTHGCNLFFLWKRTRCYWAFFFFFLRCEHVKRFWEQLQTVVNNACANGLFVNLSESIVLLGHDCSFKSDDTFDLIILLAKFFIYKCKVNKNIPQFHLLRNYLKTAFEAYKYIAIINMSYDKFTKEWQFYKTLMES